MRKNHYRNRKIAGYSYSPRENIAQKQQQAYRRIFIVVAVIIISLILIFKNIDVIIEKITGIGKTFDNQEELKTPDPLSLAQDNLLWTPQIDSIPTITNQKKLTVTGTAYQGIQVELFFNGDGISVDDLDENKKFEFTDLNLISGENSIAVRSIKEDGTKSELSSESKITLDLKPADLEVNSPTDGQKFGQDSQKIKVIGKTDLDAKPYVNDHIVILKPDGTFEYQITLNEGENTIKVKALDPAGNETVKEIKVTFDPNAAVS
ncbi:hypothetical protein A2X44_00865 [candidate division CPR3 bacterium GWF2_35_18]|uniref:Bacillopeptidase F n=1 Tax=candidate division CPR3 bacterium GW2011_GWF2_35_18 TaxID=1618350 RepID=A0A0G0BLD9_UNCC3|nr:MAG: Bacillopeptidase F [candidate division CPR3 bacterium GW2011_GWF2_35_18]OGB63456.1 MAG: hypothetical protein A2X44_00865 [candidate division CPR3 bacterium GWF2_35_18]OGB64798.1 MAG: hypothetical protein A2250_05160 [candidate division CPR3 bacterium RIFOXYA2_FULL_35_13]OGB76903.1 MAG: hypothetical protein A2476_02330 [candidate division CPR3 bacterium RIFOXYC2_FULL_35_7]OGB78574.1 MAG: hypothetical protein A2296_01470 [candidate division CPR3 bacterium RIFOXYB2_FULL_35_8]